MLLIVFYKLNLIDTLIIYNSSIIKKDYILTKIILK